MKKVFWLLILSGSPFLYGQIDPPQKSIYLKNGNVFTKTFPPFRVESYTVHFDVEDLNEPGDWNIHAHIYLWGATLDGLVPNFEGKYTDPMTRAQLMGSEGQMDGYVLLQENWQADLIDAHLVSPIQHIPGLPADMDARSDARGKTKAYASALDCPDTYHLIMRYDEEDAITEEWGQDERSSEILGVSKPAETKVEVVDHKCGQDTVTGNDIMDLYWRVSHIPGVIVPKVQVKVQDPDGETWHNWQGAYNVEGNIPIQGDRDFARGYFDTYYLMQRGKRGRRPDVDSNPDPSIEEYVMRADIVDAFDTTITIMSSAEVTVGCTIPMNSGQ